MIAAPLLVGALQLTVTLVLPMTPVTLAGAAGTVAGVAALDAVDGLEDPMAFIATTLKV